MCDWGGGPNSMANYLPPSAYGENVRKVAADVREWGDAPEHVRERCLRAEEALRFYADTANYEWREVTAEETPDWDDEDRAYCHSSTVLLDDGARARAALGEAA